MPDRTRPTLIVCTTCKRAGAPAVDAEAVPEGRRLFEAARTLAVEADGAAPARVVPVVCFANCERGCTAALSAAGKWTYMVGGLGPEHAADLLAYAAAYARSEMGTVPRSGRPESLRHAIVARFPAHTLDPNLEDAAE